jgi:hypothetical protein
MSDAPKSLLDDLKGHRPGCQCSYHRALAKMSPRGQRLFWRGQTRAIRELDFKALIEFLVTYPDLIVSDAVRRRL